VDDFEYVGRNETNQNSIKKKLRADGSKGMLVFIRFEIFVFKFAIRN
jgi:hypothetical protein